MLLNKNTTCSCGGNCACVNKLQNESTGESKELLGSFDYKIPVLEISKNNYKVIKEQPNKNILLS